MSIRSFVALSLPNSLATAIGDDIARLSVQDKESRVRWLDEDNLHVTLAFLGNLEQLGVQALDWRLEEIASSCPTIELKIESLSLFPYGKRPKVLAAMLKPCDALLGLHRQVKRSARDAGIYLEKRRYTPHITLGRLRGHSRRDMSLPSLATGLSDIAPAMSLYESTLTPDGAIYDELFRYDLVPNVDDLLIDDAAPWSETGSENGAELNLEEY
ncbi:MAG: RNA 2',3'-cyclic phosphodiesterase [Proteobacteria bacterium]|jgi:RNA 2',3'-cyclic 3'-phosphodiesterase|nr:RNA 2',3'-cyclic phosphodiesterase [Pseudomonadota bacterium]